MKITKIRNYKQDLSHHEGDCIFYNIKYACKFVVDVKETRTTIELKFLEQNGDVLTDHIISCRDANNASLSNIQHQIEREDMATDDRPQKITPYPTEQDLAQIQEIYHVISAGEVGHYITPF